MTFAPSPLAAPTVAIYLSRLVLDPRSRPVRKALGDNRLYGVLLNAFESSAIGHHSGSAPRPRGLLWRVEPPEPHTPPRVLVQSIGEPDWDRLPPGVIHASSTPETKPFAPVLSPGDRLRFRLRANPTVAAPGEQIAPGKHARGDHRVAYWKVIRDFEEPLREALSLGDTARFAELTRQKNARIEQALADWLAKRLEGAASLSAATADTWFDFGDNQPPRRPMQLRVIPEPAFRVDPSAKHHPDRKRGEGDLSPFLFEGVLTVENPEALLSLVRSGIGRAKAFGCGLLSLARA